MKKVLIGLLFVSAHMSAVSGYPYADHSGFVKNCTDGQTGRTDLNTWIEKKMALVVAVDRTISKNIDQALKNFRKKEAQINQALKNFRKKEAQINQALKDFRKKEAQEEHMPSAMSFFLYFLSKCGRN